MAQISRSVMPEDNFALLDAGLNDMLVQEVRRTAQATRNRARQNIVNWDAILTGDLWRSVGIEYSADGTEAEVYAAVDYASYVHDGTEKMQARPFLAKALEAQTAQTIERLAQALKDVTR